MALTKIKTSNIINDGNLGRRNLVINGAMQVAQRGTSVTGVTGPGYYTVDRFAYNQSGRDQAIMTVSQVSDAPDGFTKSFKIETTTAETAIDATEYFMARHKIEAQDLQHLKYGTSSAQQLTLSFWVKSSIAATYAVYLYSPDGTRIIGSTYTIDTASTWEYKTITFAGDTGGTINDDTGSGLDLAFVLAAGSDMITTDNTSWSAYSDGNLAYGHTANSLVTTVGETWQITGVQLEVGDEATPFEHRSFGEELALCQRYFSKSYDYNDAPATVTQVGAMYDRMGTGEIVSNRAVQIQFPVDMRSSPTVTVYSLNGTSGAISDCTTSYTHNADDMGVLFNGTDGTRGISKIQGNNSDDMIGFHFTADSEL